MAIGRQDCAAPVAGEPYDLTWLVHRVGQRLRAGLDAAARGQGLAGAREWIVLAALDAVPGRTQLALAADLGLDKTTLTSVLDRLEDDALVIRQADPTDRRARLPQITARGRAVQARVTRGRDAAEQAATAGLSEGERRQLRDLLLRLAPGPDVPHGSCM